MKKKHLWIIAAFLMMIFMTSQIAVVKTPVLESYILKCKVLNDRSSIADYLILAESTNSGCHVQDISIKETTSL